MAVRFTTTQLRGLNAAGRTSDLQHGLISAVLTSRLGPDYSALFPEFTVRDSDTRDWFVDAPPAPVPVSNLPDAERRAAYLRCHQMLIDIRTLADTIEKEGSNGRIMARALRDAAVFPPEDLWVRNGQPVIVNWGYYRAATGPTAISVISEDVQLPSPTMPAPAPAPIATPAPEPIAPPPPAPPKKRRRWWLSAFLWLLFAGLVATIYALFLPACALRLPGSGYAFGYCPAVSSAHAAVEDGIRLRRQVEQAELDLSRQQQDCAVENQRRADIEHAHPGPATVTPKQPVPPTPQVQKAKKEADLRLPPDAPRGKTEITLLWDGFSDLDLIVECPNGETLWHAKLEACGGGHLMKDINSGSEDSKRPDPSEHAAWPDAPPPGDYKIYVELYDYRSAPRQPIPFKVLIKTPTQERLIDNQKIGDPPPAPGEHKRILVETVHF